MYGYYDVTGAIPHPFGDASYIDTIPIAIATESGGSFINFRKVCIANPCGWDSSACRLTKIYSKGQITGCAFGIFQGDILHHAWCCPRIYELAGGVQLLSIGVSITVCVYAAIDTVC